MAVKRYALLLAGGEVQHVRAASRERAYVKAQANGGVVVACEVER